MPAESKINSYPSAWYRWVKSWIFPSKVIILASEILYRLSITLRQSTVNLIFYNLLFKKTGSVYDWRLLLSSIDFCQFQIDIAVCHSIKYTNWYQPFFNLGRNDFKHYLSFLKNKLSLKVQKSWPLQARQPIKVYPTS